MFVQVFPLEDPTNPLVGFRQGTHILGRGDALKCNDKRISRNHASLVVTADHIELSSIHINPCFLRIASSKTITILSKDSTTKLHDGDCFSFLPDIYWFKLKIASNGDDEHKRQLEDGEAVPEKRQKCEEQELSIEEQHGIDIQPNSDLEIEASKDEVEVSRSLNEEQNSGNKNHNNADDTLPQEKCQDQSNDDISINPEVTEEPQNQSKASNDDPVSTDAQDEAQTQNSQTIDRPGPSAPRPHRERCWYAASCYRRNDLHRQDYCHPGDSDYESDPDDKRPVCQYGAACYRKNKSHRKDFKHPARERPDNKPKKRARKKVDRLNAADSQDLRELDLSDSEDPFIADDDSDEYEEETDDDSDWEDSQQVDEDSENVKRLVKEAKKFVQK